MPCASFFSEKLNFKKERITPKEGKVAPLPFTSFFSSKLAPPKEEQLTPKEEKAMLFPFAGFLSNLLVPPKEKPVTPWEGKALRGLIQQQACAAQGEAGRAERGEGRDVDLRKLALRKLVQQPALAVQGQDDGAEGGEGHIIALRGLLQRRQSPRLLLRRPQLPIPWPLFPQPLHPPRQRNHLPPRPRHGIV